MTAAPAVTTPQALTLTLPGGRALLGWWRELAPLQPRRFWFAHLLLHHVEALVAVVRPSPLDRLQQTLLRALSLPAGAGAGLLHASGLEPAVLLQELRGLARRGLLRPGAPGAPCSWELTDAGRQALTYGGLVLRERERRAFYFSAQPACYLPLTKPPAAPLPAPEGWRFDVGLLRACVGRPAEWKAQHQFPADVEGVVGAATDREPSDWREVVLDRPEELRLALVQVPPGPGGPALLGFAVQAAGWSLNRATPVLALGEGWEDTLRDLQGEPAAEAWRAAWQAWCQPRGLPPGEVADCQVEAQEHRLLVRAPPRLVERLRAARSDAVKGEAWLLAGVGRCRAAALIELVEAT
jgi:hypothetical protein